MPYLNLDLDYFTHPKIVRLIGILGVEHVSLPIRLWCYVGKYHCATGMLQGYSIGEVESAVQWAGESGKMVDAMLKINLLEKLENGYRVHDWSDHAGHLLAFKKRAKSAAKKRWHSIAKGNASSTPNDEITNAPNHPNLPILTKPTKSLSVRATRLAALEAFEISKEMSDWAMREFQLSIPSDVLGEFKNYWREKKQLYANWDDTFKNRIRHLVSLGVLKSKVVMSQIHRPPFPPPKTDPIARGQWKKVYGDPKDHGYD